MKSLLLLTLATASLFAFIDINHDNVKELQKLHGIGFKKAQLIVEYRKSHGCFENIETLANVKGISIKTVEKNKSSLEAKACIK
jgi:competence protein ComEA